MAKSEQLQVLGKEETGVVERSAMDIATTRAAQEIQAAMVIAKKFPRDINSAYSRILQACKRKGIAEAAEYAYPRGDKTVGGPSIRMAEVLAQNWGNIDYGIIELEQKHGESSVMAYAWDLETNSRQTKIFTVKHERHTRAGVTMLRDPRDIYEMTANQGARRLRACILGVIPKDIVDDALEQCDKTLKGSSTEPLADRVKKMAAAFSDWNVTVEMIERRLSHKLDSASETELVQLRKIYLSIKDNMAGVASYFPPTRPEDDPNKSRAENLADKLTSQGKPEEPPTTPVAKAEPISAAQKKRLFAIAGESGVTEETLRKHLSGMGIEHISEIPKDVYDEVCKWVGNGGQYGPGDDELKM